MRSSLDTNILVYASDEDCTEHHAARRIVEKALADPLEWIIADQVLLEYYKALRNPKIFRKPMGAAQAAKQLQFLREETGLSFCRFQDACWDDLLKSLSLRSFPYQRTHDAILAVTLRAEGVERFYTRNRKDFKDAGFAELIDPIGGE